MLSKSELKNLGPELDGQYDPQLTPLLICISPTFLFPIDLLGRDISFGSDVVGFDFQIFLDELKDGRYDKDDEVMKQIRNMFAKGITDDEYEEEDDDGDDDGDDDDGDD